MSLIVPGFDGLEMSESDAQRLTATQREDRLMDLIDYSFALLDHAKAELLDGHDLAGVCVLFSGGNDSTTLAHLFKDHATHAIHANTTIGVEETRQYVRDTCAAWGLPLIEPVAPTSYDDLVVDQGFPGPAMHFKMYQRLKERGLRLARKQLVSNPRRERVIFLAGRRRAESKRRSDIVEMEREGSTVWVSPLVPWTKVDMNTYRLVCGDVPVNTVSERLGMSGECLCGAFAEPGEFERLAEHFPIEAQGIRDLEHRVRDAGHPDHKCSWGWGAYKDDPEALAALGELRSGPLCSSCDARFERHPLNTTRATASVRDQIRARREGAA